MIAEQGIVVSDSSKFKKSGLVYIESSESIDKVITDDGIEEKVVEILGKKKVEVIIVQRL